MKKKIRKNLGPIAFLKTVGLQFGKSHNYLDQLFLNSFTESEREHVLDIWEKRNLGKLKTAALYSLIKTQKQAALSFSHDVQRILISFNFFTQKISDFSPRSVVDIGCGAGFLLQYLRFLHPNLELIGVDKQQNLLDTIPKEKNIELICADYFDQKATDCVELVISDFGWDNDSMPEPSPPHVTVQLNNTNFCINCSNELIPYFRNLIHVLANWTNPNGKIILCGRLADFSDIRALFLAAKEEDWVVNKNEFQVLSYKSTDGAEYFPAFVFSHSTNSKNPMSLQEIETIYSQSRNFMS